MGQGDADLGEAVRADSMDPVVRKELEISEGLSKIIDGLIAQFSAWYRALYIVDSTRPPNAVIRAEYPDSIESVHSGALTAFIHSLREDPEFRNRVRDTYPDRRVQAPTLDPSSIEPPEGLIFLEKRLAHVMKKLKDVLEKWIVGAFESEGLNESLAILGAVSNLMDNVRARVFSAVNKQGEVRLRWLGNVEPKNIVDMVINDSKRPPNIDEDGSDLGTLESIIKGKRGPSDLSLDDWKVLRLRIKEVVKLQDLAKELGINYSVLSRVLSRNTTSHARAEREIFNWVLRRVKHSGAGGQD